MSRSSKTDEKPYRIVGAYDTETTNFDDGVSKRAFFVLYQLLELSCPVEDVTSQNVEEQSEVRIWRHAAEVWEYLREKYIKAHHDFVPVIAVHNLAFDMHSLSSWFLGLQDEGYEIRVLAKTPQKPITFTVCKDNDMFLCFWDTLGFSRKSLAVMGLECGFRKAVGDWDYNLIRTPETSITPEELRYAQNDVKALVCWLGWFLRREPLVRPDALAHHVVTKTSVVRAKRSEMLGTLKGHNSPRTVGQYWSMLNQAEKLADDDMLMTFHACTRGGLTFASANLAGVPFDFSKDSPKRIYAFDAKSQHPAQMVSHFYPVKFAKQTQENLQLDLDIIASVSREILLKNFSRPFPVAFCACVEFFGLRLKSGSVFERDGIASLAFARVKSWDAQDERDEYREYCRAMGLADDAPLGCEQLFGKVMNAPVVRLFLTEIEYWIMTRVYDWEKCVALFGFDSTRFVRPTDFSVLSVMRFYENKNTIKQVKSMYEQGKPCRCDFARGVLPDYLIESIERGEAERRDIQLYYMSAKEDLNALYGIEITDEAKRDMVLDDDGIEYEGAYGADNLPKKCKTWYQFGQRVVAWSRVAQVLHCELFGRYGCIVNGDTDSVKVISDDFAALALAAQPYNDAIDKAKRITCARVKKSFPTLYSELEGIGHYEHENTFMRFYSAWSKAYIADDWRITLAGVPTEKRSVGECDSVSDYAKQREENGEDFGAVCRDVLGYNSAFDASLTKLNERYIPKFASFADFDVTDYRGQTAHVSEPAAVALFPMEKVIGGLDNQVNRENWEKSEENAGNMPHDLRLHYHSEKGFGKVEL